MVGTDFSDITFNTELTKCTQIQEQAMVGTDFTKYYLQHRTDKVYPDLGASYGWY